MKFVRYTHKTVDRIGCLRGDSEVVDLTPFFASLVEDAPTNLNHLIDQWSDDWMQRVLDYLKTTADILSIDDVQLLAPIAHPKRHLFCLGKNYLDHAKETAGLPGGQDDIPKFPIYFAKVADPCIGPGEIIQEHPGITDKVDYEVELAVVIGKDGINIAPEEAEDHIFGYTIVNDVSARNVQRKHGQWFKGKSLGTYCPIGPCLVHKSAIPFPVELDIQCRINGALRQDSNTRQLIFDIPSILSDLSKGMYLRKGDIVITGTPAGVGLGFTPFKFLKPGDRIDCTIERIGTLTNWFAYQPDTK